MEPPFEPVIPLLGIYPEKIESAYYSDATVSKFIAAQFTIAKLWTLPGHLSTDEQIKKLWYIYTMEYFSAIKNKIIVFVSK